MKLFLPLTLVLLLSVLHGVGAATPERAVSRTKPVQWVLGADAWASPRSGDELVQQPALREAVQQAGKNKRLVIRYPLGEEGVLWAQELKSWLVALGMPSRQLSTQPGYQRNDTLILFLQDQNQTEKTP